jgi:cytochrome c biogenesis protein CcdA
MESGWASILPSAWLQAVTLGSWFGLLHAFDPDHLATIGGLVAWTSYADYLVGAALLLIGTNALRAVWRRRGVLAAANLAALPRAGAPLVFPADHALTEHARAMAHTHVHFLAPFHSHARVRSGHTGLLLGVLHGGAGSAAVLALLPLAYFKSGAESALYLLFFSAGVTAGALGFAKLFALCSTRALARGEKLADAFQTAIGVLAIASGVWLFFELTRGRG